MQIATRGSEAELALARKVLNAQDGDNRIALLLSDVCEALGARWITMFRVNTLSGAFDRFTVYEGRELAGIPAHAQQLAPSPSIAPQLVEQAERDLGGWSPVGEIRVAPARRDDRNAEHSPQYAWVQLPAGRPYVWCLGAIRLAGTGGFPEAHESVLVRTAWTTYLLSETSRAETSAAQSRPPWAALTHAMPVGIAVVNAQREVLFCNDAMQDVIAHKDALDVQGNRLVALRQEDDRKLDSLVRRSATNVVDAAANQSFMALARPAPHSAYGVAIQRMSSDTPSEPVVAIQISEADRGLELSRAAIREFFGLTPTEAEIAARLADGNNISEIASALDIRPGTVRVHLRSIYRKTRVSRQGELVRLVLCSIARFALR